MHLVVTFLDERLRTPAVGRAAQTHLDETVSMWSFHTLRAGEEDLEYSELVARGLRLKRTSPAFALIYAGKFNIEDDQSFGWALLLDAFNVNWNSRAPDDLTQIDDAGWKPLGRPYCQFGEI